MPATVTVTAVRTLVVLRSQNAKTGVVAATYRMLATCPTGCAMYGACYAADRPGGRPSPFSRAERGADDSGAADIVRLAERMPAGGTLRLNVSGDFLDGAGGIDYQYIGAVNQLVAARPDITVIGYTHAWRILPVSLFRGWLPAASCDTRADCVDAIAAGYAPAIVDSPDSPDSLRADRIAGRRVVSCPFETSGRQCVDCKLCARQSRAIVAFTPHGPRRRAIARAIAARRAE